jgi:hypothetical protein
LAKSGPFLELNAKYGQTELKVIKDGLCRSISAKWQNARKGLKNPRKRLTGTGKNHVEDVKGLIPLKFSIVPSTTTLCYKTGGMCWGRPSLERMKR